MKVYKSVAHISFDHISNIENKFQIGVVNEIRENQKNGYESEVQYSTCATENSVIYSALILAYTEE